MLFMPLLQIRAIPLILLELEVVIERIEGGDFILLLSLAKYILDGYMTKPRPI